MAAILLEGTPKTPTVSFDDSTGLLELKGRSIPENSIAALAGYIGPHKIMWATDYPHPDHPATWAPSLERFVAPLSAETRANVLGRNVARLYGLNDA